MGTDAPDTTDEIRTLQERLRSLEEECTTVRRRLVLLEQKGRRTGSPVPKLGTPASAKVPRIPKEKVDLFLRLFRCREDVYPKLWENKKRGTKGYSPACQNEWRQGICEKPRTKCSVCPERKFLPLDESAIESHLRGHQTIGTYAIRGDDTCVFLACDFDGAAWPGDVLAYKSAAEDIGVDVGIERSRSGKGAHAWIFFTSPVPARAARTLGTIILTRSMDMRHSMPLKSYDRFFPNQDYLPKGGFGNLIALPLQKVPREGGNTVFIGDDLMAHEDQWGFLSRIRVLSPFELDGLNRRCTPRLSASMDERDFQLRCDEGIIEPAAVEPQRGKIPSRVEITLTSHLSIPLAGLPSRVVAALKRSATFPNPKFYELQRMRMATYPHPRFIFSGEERPDALIMPRGGMDKILSLLKKAGAEVSVVDGRPRRRKIAAVFAGNLRDAQQAALDELKKHEYGVLVAPPGSGKTVIACALIAERQVSTLVVVHRSPLVEQWRDRICEFTGTEKKEIGTISGARSKPTGKIDIAMIQSLARNPDMDVFSKRYSQVIVDECHHIPASSFEGVLRQIQSRYVLGLTATPYRKDGLERIIFQQCGPARYEIRPSDLSPGISREVMVRETGLRLPEPIGQNPPYHVLAEHLTNDPGRNAIIADDIASELQLGRHVLVLTDRKAHVVMLAGKLDEELKRREVGAGAAKVFCLDGAAGSRKRLGIFSEMDSYRRAGTPCCMIATASLIGEGLDLPYLDSLVLAMPLSFKGRLVQYVGRLERTEEGKDCIKVFDYLDSACPTTLKMYRKRASTYRTLRFTVNEPGTEPLLQYNHISGLG